MTSCLRYASRMATRPVARTVIAQFQAIPRTSFRFFTNDLTKDSIVTKYARPAPTVRYTEDHEWIALHNDGVGITKYAADALGDATYVELPAEGDEVVKGGSFGSVESVKSASELYSPAAGTVVESNEKLVENAALINQDPMGEGWITKLKVNDSGEIGDLMNVEQYEEFLKTG